MFFKFYINNIETNEPLEVNGVKFILAQDPMYKGYFRKESLKNVTLIKEAALIVKKIYDTELNPETLFTIKKKSASGIYNVHEECVIKYSSYSEGIKDGEGFSVKVDLVDNNFQSKLRNREKINVVIGKDVSIGGKPITGSSLIKANILKKPLRQSANWKWSEYLQTVNAYPGGAGYAAAPQEFGPYGNTRLQRYGMTYNSGVLNQNMYNDIINTGLELQENSNIPFASSSTSANYNEWVDNSFAYFGLRGDYEPENSSMIMGPDIYDRQIQLNGTLDFVIDFFHTYEWDPTGVNMEIEQNRKFRFVAAIYLFEKPSASSEVYQPTVLIDEVSVEIIAHDLVEDAPVTGVWGANYKLIETISHTIDQQFVKPKDSVVGVFTKLDYLGDPDGWKEAPAAGNSPETQVNRFARTVIDGSLTELSAYFDTNDEEFPDSEHEGQMIYEYIESQLKQCTDNDDPFRSKAFGRVDLGYEEDGEFSNIFVTDGLLLRNAIDTDGNTTKLSGNFYDTYQTLNSLKGLRMDFIDGRIHIEKRTYYRENAVYLEYTDIDRKEDQSMMYNEIHVGNNKVQYENVNGLYEFNALMKYTTPLDVENNILNLVTKINTDYTAIEYARRLGLLDSDNNDSKYDQLNFLLEVEKIGGKWTTQTVADKYDIINGTILPDFLFNLGFSPGNMIENNKDLINACMYKATGHQIVFQVGESLAKLESRKIGETLVLEQSNYTTENPPFFPLIYTLTMSEKEAEKVFPMLGNYYVFDYLGETIEALLFSVEDSEEKTIVKLLPIKTIQ